MSHPYHKAAHRQDTKFARSLHKFADGGGVSQSSRERNATGAVDSTKTSSRFLPRYDFDYDPTGGHTTGQMTDFGASPEIDSMKASLNKSDLPTIRQSQDDAGVGMSDQLRKRGGKVR